MKTIYEIRDGSTVKYVGCTKQPLHFRLTKHRRAADYGKTSRMALWMKEHGHRATIHAVQTVADQEARVVERAWIEDHLDAGRDLLNVRACAPVMAKRYRAHCTAGHALEPDNFYTYSNGKRVCIICSKARAAKWRKQKDEA